MAEVLTDSGLWQAMLEVRMLPWKPRPRVMKPSALREGVSNIDFAGGVDDLAGVALALGIWLAIMIAAPVIVLVLAGALLSVELPIIVAIAALLTAARLAGIIPWTVIAVDKVTGRTRRERHRNGLRALRRIREINGDRRVYVRWSWV